MRKVNVGFNLTPAMISGRVDATLGSFWNYEGVELERRDSNPTILKRRGARRADLQRARRSSPARRTRASAARVLRRFLQGLAAGHAALREDPDAGIDPLLAGQQATSTAACSAPSSSATLPVFFPEDEDQPFGWMDERRVAGLRRAGWSTTTCSSGKRIRGAP